MIASLASFADVYGGSYMSRLKKLTSSFLCLKYTYDTELLAKNVYYFK